MFTKRFIKIPVDLYNKKESDMIGYGESTKGDNVDMRINPFEVSHYRPGHDDKDEFTATLIHMKNGDSFYSSISIDEFENVLNEFDNDKK